jgi:hypothetical protein
MRTLRLVAPFLLVLLAGVLAAPAQASTGPAYSVSESSLAAALTCSKAPSKGLRPVLLVHGTTLTAATNWDWNYERAYDAQGRPWCAVDLPRGGMGNIAAAAEYVTHAIRTMARRAVGRIDVVGFSQGGMLPRWSLKYWPDTRADVADLVAIDPSNYGTLDAQLICRAACPPAFWQQRTGSHFLAALNAGPDTFAGIDYTVVYTLTDEVVTPNLPPRPASALRDGEGRRTAIAAQGICPVHLAEHLSMGTTDPVAWAVAQDALTHAGPASASRVPRSACLKDVMPGVDRTRLAVNLARMTAQIGTAVATSPQSTAEPSLPAYAR